MSEGEAKAAKQRVDLLMVERGLCDSRARAQALIMAGQVVVADRRVDKPGQRVPSDAELRIKGEGARFVSRGGDKLEGALASFERSHPPGVPIADRVAIDVGASTGGFTDCLLQRGAARVFAVDVGYGQLAWKLASDPKVVVMDRTNIRDLEPGALETAPSLCVADCSFISLTKVLPPLLPLLAPGADLVLLVKPQFELGPGAVGKGGIVRDEGQRAEALTRVQAAATELGAEVVTHCESPVAGQKGNREWLLWLRKPPADLSAGT